MDLPPAEVPFGPSGFYPRGPDSSLDILPVCVFILGLPIYKIKSLLHSIVKSCRLHGLQFQLWHHPCRWPWARHSVYASLPYQWNGDNSIFPGDGRKSWGRGVPVWIKEHVHEGVQNIAQKCPFCYDAISLCWCNYDVIWQCPNGVEKQKFHQAK